MNSRRVKLVVLALVAMAVVILAGIGTSDSFAHDGNLWGEPDSEAVQSEGPR